MSLQDFHPVVRRWFIERVGSPSPPQVEGWPLIRSGRHTLISAPTGTGKTLAAFLWAIDGLLRQGDALRDETQVLYVSPLKALGNDVQKNLSQPLSELRSLEPSFPEVRVLVRTGDTRASERAAMSRRPPHILVTTPESLYIMLTSDTGRAMLRTVRTVILDEIHAVAGDKRGAHLALSIERLEALVAGSEDDFADESRADRGVIASLGDDADLPGGEPPCAMALVDSMRREEVVPRHSRLQRIGLSATQKPIEDLAHLLVGVGRDCARVDIGHRRDLDLAIELPDSPLETVCSHETWDQIVARMAELILGARTTLVFVNTRKLAERIAARLTDALGADQVTSHHGSLSRERRLDAEARLKRGSLRALVATASLELGIDIGDVDLAIQVGVTASIATFLQRVGRSGHGLDRTPRGRIFPLTQDDLVTATALLDAVRRGELDRTPQPGRPLDILAQQIVAACVPETWEETRLFEALKAAWPYRDLERSHFDDLIVLHSAGRGALLHRDGVNGRIRATRRARITALTSGGAIPDTGQYRVLLEPEGIVVGSLDEDFAIESNVGDVFQLGNTSWRILKVEPGAVRVADARGIPPSVPFWFGEAPARTRELSASIARVRVEGRDPEWTTRTLGVSRAVADQLAEYLNEGERTLGAIPTPTCVVLERFFDESGGMQLVIHAPFGGRINRAWGLALRKRFCRGFGFELQAAANEEAIVLSLGLQHSFPLEEVFDYLHPDVARDLLVQALLDAPMFGTRWRWNLSRALLLPRTQNGGKRVPTPLLRMRAEDQLAKAFPEVLACGETLPPGDLPVPWEHALVRQTIEDCLTEAMDAEGWLQVLRDLKSGTIRRVAVDNTEPSAFARGILNAMPYAFLDDAPLEERRTQAVASRRTLDARTADTLGALDADAVARVREQAWPQPESAEEMHEALLWMGYATSREAAESGWLEWLGELRAAGRAVCEEIAIGGGASARWFATEAPRDPKSILRGRLEALGPVFVSSDDSPRASARSDIPIIDRAESAPLLALEHEGVVLRCRLEGREAWCERRLLARIHRDTLERLRREIEPVTAAELWRFLVCWQHADESFRLEGPRGVAQIVRQLAGFEIPAIEWESSILPARVRGFRSDWLDQLTITGEIAWGRLWGQGNSALRSTPLCLVPRDELDSWWALATGDETRRPDSGTPDARENGDRLSTYAKAVLDSLDQRGPCFTQELERRTGMLSSHVEMGLTQLIGHGLVSCDSFAGLRRMITPPSKRRGVMKRAPLVHAGRWSRFRAEPIDLGHVFRAGVTRDEALTAFVARRLLDRYGVVFRRLIERERFPVPWRDLVRVYRHQELRGDVRGGRFVQRFAGEQYALPEAVELMRRLRRKSRSIEDAVTDRARDSAAPARGIAMSAADPLNLAGILTPDERVPALPRRRVLVG